MPLTFAKSCYYAHLLKHAHLVQSLGYPNLTFVFLKYSQLSRSILLLINVDVVQNTIAFIDNTSSSWRHESISNGSIERYLGFLKNRHNLRPQFLVLFFSFKSFLFTFNSFTKSSENKVQFSLSLGKFWFF